jgi:hypothetical protein
MAAGLGAKIEDAAFVVGPIEASEAVDFLLNGR